jgi:hypothetical protein
MFSHGGHLVECFVENTVITVSTVRDLDGHVQLRSPCRPLTMLTVLTQTPLLGGGRNFPEATGLWRFLQSVPVSVRPIVLAACRFSAVRR